MGAAPIRATPRDYATAAMTFMDQVAVSPTPNNYALWYTYASGSVPALNRELDHLRQRDAAIDEIACRSLYSQFLAANTNASELEQAARQIESSICGAIAVVDEAGQDTAGYAQSLTSLSQGITAVADATVMQRVMGALLASTREMVQKARAASSWLDRSQQEMSELRARLEVVSREAETDGLTGLGNRKALDRVLACAIADAENEQVPMSLLMIDVDHFKRFNDSYGHAVGDEVLRLLAKVLKARVKGADFVGRYGGEEFAIVLPKTGLDGAMAVAERIRADLAARHLTNVAKQTDYGTITVSLGAAQFVTGETTDKMFGRADQALYRAKTEARNRVVGLRADGSVAPPPKLMH